MMGGLAVSGVPEISREAIRAAFDRVRLDRPHRLKVRVRRWRAAAIRRLLADADALDLATFNREVWRLGNERDASGQDLLRQLAGDQAPSEESTLDEVERLLDSDQAELHGNGVWRAGSRVFAPRASGDEERLANLRTALRILNDTRLTPPEKARQIERVKGFGWNTATGLVMLYHPAEFAIWNDRSTPAIERLGYDAHTLEDFEAAAAALRVLVGADDYLELDYFLMLISLGVLPELAQDRAVGPVSGGRTWIFQSNPAYYLLSDALKQLPELLWGVKQHAGEIHVGDQVFLWESGRDAGVVALATVTTEPGVATEDGRDRDFVTDPEALKSGHPLVTLRIDRVLNERLSKARLTTHAVLGGLSIIKRPPLGTNFAVTPEQARALLALLPGDTGTVARPVPVEVSFGELLAALRAQGLYFDSELVSTYVLALQTKRFVILTGISGTGKTQLALAVADAFGQAADGAGSAGNASGPSLVVAVRPDWTDSRGLLGYFNPLLERYVSTPTLVFLLAAEAECQRAAGAGRVPAPYFLVLDEMNLAHVEHYFSDFLSAMESGQAMELHGERRADTAGPAPAVPPQVPVPQNLFVIGTVNVDETTYMFSPKVLDRAFTIELDRVDLHGYGQDEPIGRATGNELRLERLPGRLVGVQRPGIADWLAFSSLLDGELHQAIVTLHALLEPWHRHFGYRVANEIARFVCLAAEQTDGGPESLRAALDLAVLAKVLPKFHGTQQELEEPLRAVFGFALAGPPEPRASASDREWNVVRGVLEPAGTASAEALRVFLPRTAAKVWRMLQRLRAQGFTAYIE